MKNKLIIAFIALAVFFASTPIITAQTAVNVVTATIWKRYAGDIYTTPVNLNMSLGTSTQFGLQTVIDRLFVEGKINSNYTLAQCISTGFTTQITGDTSQACSDYAIVEDAAGIADSIGDPITGTNYWRLKPGTAGVTAAASDGMAITFFNRFLMSATNTPSFEAVARIGAVQQASTTLVLIGNATTTGLSDDYALVPGGCFFTASTTAANFVAVCKNGSTYSQTNTGVASSSVSTGDGSWYRFRIDQASTTARFYIQSTSTNLTLVATIVGMSVPSTTPMNPVASIAKVSAGLSPALDVRYVKTWYKESIW